MDAFSLLTAGVRFQRKDVEGFSRSSAAAAPAGVQGGGQAHASHAPPGRHAAQPQQGSGAAGAQHPSQASTQRHAAGPSIAVFSKGASSKGMPGSNGRAGRAAAAEGAEDAGAGEGDELAARIQSGSEASTSGLVDPGCPVVATGDALEAANVVRKHYKIKVTGTEPPPALRSWAELEASSTGVKGGRNAARVLIQNLQARGYSQPTPIQRQAIPALMAARDLFAVAPTGSGKTVAFLAPVLLQLRALRARARAAAQEAERARAAVQEGAAAGSSSSSKKGRKAGGAAVAAALAAAEEAEGLAQELWPAAIKAVVLSPSHELTAQQARVLKHLLPGSNLCASTLTKSTAAGSDFSKVDILLANPLRLATLAEGGKLDLSQVRFLVLDEADKLFDMGFVEQIDAVLHACSHKEIVRALFSATLPEKVEELASCLRMCNLHGFNLRPVMQNFLQVFVLPEACVPACLALACNKTVLRAPLRVTVGVRNTAVSTVAQRLLFVGREAGKLLALRQLLAEGLRPPVLVFVATKERARALHRELMYDGVRVDSLSASQSMAARTAAVDNFRSGRTWVLVSTDVIGRGMDFVGVSTVVNYDFPASTMDYIHRIGRTGRAGHTGCAVTFFTEEDKLSLRPIANLIREAGGEVPDWMVAMKRTRAKDRRAAPLAPEVGSGSTISTRPAYDRKQAKRRKQMIDASKAKKAKTLQQPQQ